MQPDLRYSFVFLTMLLLFFGNSLFGQNDPGNYLLDVQSGKRIVDENFDFFIKKEKINKEEIVEGHYFRIVQFYEIPNSREREDLEKLGLRILNYIPNKAYLVAIPVAMNRTFLQNKNIRAVIPMDAEIKMDRSLKEKPFGAWAVHGSQIDIVIKYYDNLTLELIEEKLRLQGFSVTKGNEYMSLVHLRIPEDKINEVAALPYVSYLELASDVGEPEDTRGRSLHRANMIDTEYTGGRKYDGTGIKVLCRDDGFVGPHIDFHGRIIQDVDGDGGIQHADGVSGIMAGAGNLDPNNRGMAAGSDLYVIDYQADFLDNTLPLHVNEGIMVTNSSYSNGCNAGYTSITQTVDRQIFENQNLLHVFSAGNSNNQECGYGAGDQWGNITGGHKQGKNVIATANLNEDATLANSSSRGPAHDGRIKPDISANGRNQVSTDPNNTYAPFGGTSAASPGVAGVSAQLYQAYKELNGGNLPPSGLIKSTLLNTANDLGNPGPDFRFGWGHLNAYRAVRLLEDLRYEVNSIDNGQNITHTIPLPSGVRQVRFMIYWMEEEAFPGTGKALINDLDMVVTSPNGTTKLPWVLDHTPDPAALNSPATNGEDHRNNVEQVIFDNPEAGDFMVDVSGFEVPLGPQEYFLLYEIVTDEITVTYPVGGEGFEPNSAERLRWDAYGTDGQFVIDYTNDDGATWNNITTLPGSARMHNWLPPTDITGQARVRVTNNASNASDESDANFSIFRIPSNLQVTTFCPNYMTVSWNPVPDATAFDVFYLGDKFMDSVGTSMTTSFDIPLSNPLDVHWFSVRAVGDNGLRSERAVAVSYQGDLLNCVLENDVSTNTLLSPNVTSYVGCDPVTESISIEIENTGINPQDSISFSFQVNNEPVITEPYVGVLQPGDIISHEFVTPLELTTSGNVLLKAWATIPNDDVFFNDTISRNIIVNLGEVKMVPPSIVEDFEANDFPPDDWFVSNIDAGYTWESANAIGLDGSVTQVAGVYNYLFDSPGQRDELFTVPLDLSGLANPVLSFDLAYARRSNNCSDTLLVEVYTNCGETLASIVYEKFDNDLTTTSFKPFSWTPDLVADWRQEIADLQGFAGDTILVKIVNVNGDCNNLFIDNINVSDYTIPNAAFTISPQVACTGETIVFENISEGVNINYTWKFGSGAIPYNISTLPGPHEILYFTAGEKEIQLIAVNALGADTSTFTVNILDDPTPSFDYQISGLGYQFTNTSDDATDFFWDFGDNVTSTEENPLHYYANQGNYTVVLTASNICSEDFDIQTVNVTVTDVEELEEEISVQVIPNPSDGIFNLIIEDESVRDLNVGIFDLKGMSIDEWQVKTSIGSNNFPISKSHLSQGVYLLKVESEVGVKTFKLVIQ